MRYERQRTEHIGQHEYGDCAVAISPKRTKATMNTSHQPSVRNGGFAMTRTTVRPVAGTEFDEFLYAPISEEEQGLPLSVLSALARLDVDPWDEAARLASLPRAAAIQFLTTLVADAPEGSSAHSSPEEHAQRLAALLPRRVAADGLTSHSALAASVTARHQNLVRYVLFYLLLTAAFFGAQWLIERQPVRSGAVTAPAAGAPLVLTAKPAG
jgi:hypothetical protein